MPLAPSACAIQVGSINALSCSRRSGTRGRAWRKAFASRLIKQKRERVEHVPFYWIKPPAGLTDWHWAMPLFCCLLYVTCLVGRSQGLRKRAANTNASSWVLSPISAKATMAVETKKASMVGVQSGRIVLRRALTAPRLRPLDRHAVNGLAQHSSRIRHRFSRNPSVLTHAPAHCTTGGLLPKDPGILTHAMPIYP